MSSYFDHEMRLLQNAARDFARAFPEKARYLNLLDIKDQADKAVNDGNSQLSDRP